MTQELLVELDKSKVADAPKSPISNKARSPLSVLDIQISTKQVGLLLQVMHGTWFSWDVYDVLTYVRKSSGSLRFPGFLFGVQLASQTIEIGERFNLPDSPGKSIKLHLPAFRTSGTFDGMQLKSHAVLESFSLPLKPNYVDDILAVQQNLGTHFYEFLDLVTKNRGKRISATKNVERLPVAFKYDVAFMLRGFSVSLAGPTSILDLMSEKMIGTAKNDVGLSWNFGVSELALALSHQMSMKRPQHEFDRNLRSAYMVLDVRASSLPLHAKSLSTEGHEELLHLQMNKMHAVMSPNSVGELGDLIDHIKVNNCLIALGKYLFTRL